MDLSELRLTDFRNYRSAAAAFAPGMNLLVGPNGWGKTNLLEAVCYLAGRRLPRLSREAELLRWGCAELAVRGTFQDEAGPLEVRVRLPAGGRREMRWNGLPPAKSLRRGPAVVVFTPDDLTLVKGPAEERRRFLDEDLGHADRRYRSRLARYGRLVQHRNAVLKALRERPATGWAEELAPWDEGLADAAVPVTAWRRVAIRELSPRAEERYRALSSGGEALTVAYRPSAPEAAPELRYRLGQGLREQVARGHTLTGPHRDEVELMLDGRPARQFASQGQQRSAVVALKLALVDVLTARRDGDPPILLLDDVLSELDAARQEALFALAKGQQTLVTATGATPFGAAAGPMRRTEVRQVDGAAT